MDLHILLKLSLVDGCNTCCDFCADASQQRPALLIGLAGKTWICSCLEKNVQELSSFGIALSSKHLFLQPASSTGFV